MNTSCVNCIFKKLRGKRQVGCQFDRIEKFKQQGCEIVREDDHFLIKGRLCNTLRTKWWADERIGKDLLGEVWDETIPKVDFVIYLRPECDMAELSYLSILLDSIINQESSSANCIHLIVKSQDSPDAQFLNYKKMVKNSGLPWQIHTIQEQDQSDGNCLDIIFPKLTGDYISIFNTNGRIVPKTFLDDLDWYLNEQLNRFSLLTPIDNNGLTIQRSLYEYIGGSRAIYMTDDNSIIKEGIVDKLTYIAKQEGNEHLIKSVAEVCPSFTQI